MFRRLCEELADAASQSEVDMILCDLMLRGLDTRLAMRLRRAWAQRHRSRGRRVLLDALEASDGER